MLRGFIVWFQVLKTIFCLNAATIYIFSMRRGHAQLLRVQDSRLTPGRIPGKGRERASKPSTKRLIFTTSPLLRRGAVIA